MNESSLSEAREEQVADLSKLLRILIRSGPGESCFKAEVITDDVAFIGSRQMKRISLGQMIK